MKMFQKLILPAALALTMAASGAAYAGPDKNGEEPTTPDKNGGGDGDGDNGGGNNGGGDQGGGGKGFGGEGNGSGGMADSGIGMVKCAIGKKIIYVRTRSQCYNYSGSIMSRSNLGDIGLSGRSHSGNGNGHDRNRIKAGDIVIVSGRGRSGKSVSERYNAGTMRSDACGAGYGQGRGHASGRMGFIPTSRAAAMQLEKRMRKASHCGNSDLWLGAQVRRDRVSDVHVTRRSYNIRSQDGYVQSSRAEGDHGSLHTADCGHRKISKIRKARPKGHLRHRTRYYGHVKVGRPLAERGYPIYRRPGIDKNGGF